MVEPVDGGADDQPPARRQPVAELVGKRGLPRAVDAVDADAHDARRRQREHGFGHAVEHRPAGGRHAWPSAQKGLVRPCRAKVAATWAASGRCQSASSRVAYQSRPSS
jgi:hypothetical protein